MEPVFSKVSAFASRTVHIKIYPTPSSFDEQRELLRVLERFGEVTMFKSFKYHPRNPVPNAFLSIFQTEEAAQDIMNHSPIRYKLVLGPASDASSTHSPLTTAATSTEPPPTAERVFEAFFSSSKYHHETQILAHPMHGPYSPQRPRRSAMAAHLSTLLPRSPAAPGLADWETDGALWSWRRPGLAGGDGVPIQSRVLERLRKRSEKSGEVPRAMGGLAGFEKERKLRMGEGGGVKGAEEKGNGR